MTSDTPRTDAAEIKVQCGFKETGTGQVPIAESRKIERDLKECQDAGKHYRANIAQLQRDLAAANAKFAAKPDVAKLVESVKSLRAARHEWEGASSTELLLLDAVGEALLALSARLAEKEGDLAAANAALRECRQHADVMADVPGSIAANLAAERYRAWRAKIDAAIAAKEKP